MTYIHLLKHGRVGVVKVWLFLDKVMKVELLALLVPFPSWPAEHAYLKDNRETHRNGSPSKWLNIK